MDPGGEPSEESSTGGEGHPSLRDLVEKVDQRRAGRRDGPPVDDGPTDTVAERFSAPASAPKRPFDDFGSDPKTEALIELVGEASTLLLLGPLLTPADHDLCTRLATALPDDLDNLLLVTLNESPDERLRVYQGYLDELPERTLILSVGDSTRSGSRETLRVEHGGSVTIETISDPTDLMRIGITISRILSDWGDDAETSVCIHSLTALLQFAPEPKPVFRFMHVLRGRLRAAGAHAHVHMDAGAHDRQTVETFRPLFDEVLTFEEDGSLHVDH